MALLCHTSSSVEGDGRSSSLPLSLWLSPRWPVAEDFKKEV
jgi:hypothetical protein